MIVTVGCMRDYLTRMVFAGVLGMALGVAAHTVPHAAWADEIKTDAVSPESPVPNATYDESQPGADDPRVKEGFAAYQAGDFKKAYDIWLPLAEAGNAEAQFRVGRLYSFGEGKDIDIEDAIKWYKRAFAQEHIKASYNLGVIYDFGKLVSEDHLKALQYYQMAAQKCHLSAQNNLGILFATTLPPNRNFSAAHQWLFVASIRGNERATETNKLLHKNFSTIDEYQEGRKRVLEWLESHPCTRK